MFRPVTAVSVSLVCVGVVAGCGGSSAVTRSTRLSGVSFAGPLHYGAFRDGRTCPATSVGNGGGANLTPQEAAIGDVNGDGRADLVVTGYDAASNGKVSIFLSCRHDRLGLRRAYNIGPDPYYIQLADFNGDDQTDIAVARNNVVTLLTNLGGRRFSRHDFRTGGNASAGRNASGFATGDLNGDGKIDVAV